MQYIAENTEYELDCENFLRINKEIGESGIASPSTPFTPIQMLMQHEMGIERFTYFLYDYQEEMEEYMETLHDSNLKAYRIMAESPEFARVFISYEDTSTTVMSPAWYNRYCKKYIDAYADMMHKGNKIFITHMCGKLKGMIDEIKEGKMDGIDSVCPPTTGDLWSHEALAAMPDKIIIGGIEPPALKRMSVEETKAYVRKVITDCTSLKRFILSTGDATSFGTPIQNLKAVTEVVEEMGVL